MIGSKLLQVRTKGKESYVFYLVLAYRFAPVSEGKWRRMLGLVV